MGSADALVSHSEAVVNLAETDTFATPRRRKRRRVLAVPLATARAEQPIVIDLRHLLWQLSAACHGMDRELFFDAGQDDIALLRAVCADCPVRTECLDYANEHNLQGFWGGTTEDERRRERGRESRAARKARS